MFSGCHHLFEIFLLRIVRISSLLITLVIILGTAKLDKLMSNSELTEIRSTPCANLWIGTKLSRTTILKLQLPLCRYFSKFFNRNLSALDKSETL